MLVPNDLFYFISQSTTKVVMCLSTVSLTVLACTTTCTHYQIMIMQYKIRKIHNAHRSPSPVSVYGY